MDFDPCYLWEYIEHINFVFFICRLVLPSAYPGTWKMWVKAQERPLRNPPASLAICSRNCSQYSAGLQQSPALNRQSYLWGTIWTSAMLVLTECSLLLSYTSTQISSFPSSLIYETFSSWGAKWPELHLRQKFFLVVLLLSLIKKIESISGLMVSKQLEVFLPFLGFFLQMRKWNISQMDRKS